MLVYWECWFIGNVEVMARWKGLENACLLGLLRPDEKCLLSYIYRTAERLFELGALFCLSWFNTFPLFSRILKIDWVGTLEKTNLDWPITIDSVLTPGEGCPQCTQNNSLWGMELLEFGYIADTYKCPF